VVGRAADAAFALFRMRTARKRAQPTKKGAKTRGTTKITTTYKLQQ